MDSENKIPLPDMPLEELSKHLSGLMFLQDWLRQFNLLHGETMKKVVNREKCLIYQLGDYIKASLRYDEMPMSKQYDTKVMMKDYLSDTLIQLLFLIEDRGLDLHEVLMMGIEKNAKVEWKQRFKNTEVVDEELSSE